MNKKPHTTFALPTEAEMAAGSIGGLSLDNLEDRVQKLRQASEPTRKKRAAINRVSREASSERQKAKNRAQKKKP